MHRGNRAVDWPLYTVYMICAHGHEITCHFKAERNELPGSRTGSCHLYWNESRGVASFRVQSTRPETPADSANLGHNLAPNWVLQTVCRDMSPGNKILLPGYVYVSILKSEDTEAPFAWAGEGDMQCSARAACWWDRTRVHTGSNGGG
jgi:hypothetical protein